jgi:DNA polymerase III epsilon subunit-like protein
MLRSPLQVTVTLQDVQTTLRAFISERTIIVGHSADTDLKVTNCCS